MGESNEPESPASKPRTSKLAVAAFILGLMSMTCVLWPYAGLPAFICGIIALVKISGSGGRLEGKGYAIAGIVISTVVIVVILGAKNFIDGPENARVVTTRAAVRSLHEAVNMFRMDTGRYPTQEEGLNALIKKPSDVENWWQRGYLEVTVIPRDAWRHDFVYKLNPGDGHPFVIISYGADGKEGGRRYDADLLSTDSE
jgi:general secretion pathway protein G